MREFMIELAQAAGEVLLGHFGRVTGVRVKESQSSVVTDADLASERLLLERIRARYPEHGVVAEESGWVPGQSEYTWVVDPLDGTSNFAAGLPWFGVLLALLRGTEPVLAVSHLPLDRVTYWAEADQGAWRDGTRIAVSAETELRRMLCAFSLDARAEREAAAEQARMHAAVVAAARNVRATNCLLDFCYTMDGRLGGCVNLSTRIWDIAGACLLMREAGGVLTDLQGKPVTFSLDDTTCERTHAVVGAGPGLHGQIVAAMGGGGER